MTQKLIKCSKCKEQFKKAELIHYATGLLCSKCYPFYRDYNGKLAKKVPNFNGWV